MYVGIYQTLFFWSNARNFSLEFHCKKWRTAERSDMLFQSMGRGEVEEEGVLAVGTAAGWGSGSLCTGTDMS